MLELYNGAHQSKCYKPIQWHKRQMIYFMVIRITFKGSCKMYSSPHYERPPYFFFATSEFIYILQCKELSKRLLISIQPTYLYYTEWGHLGCLMI